MAGKIAKNGKTDLNISTFTKILDANPNRTKVTISNTHDKARVFIACCSVGEPVKPIGIPIMGGESEDLNEKYTGEICGIADTEAVTITFVEY
jgi:hypothetical protein